MGTMGNIKRLSTLGACWCLFFLTSFPEFAFPWLQRRTISNIPSKVKYVAARPKWEDTGDTSSQCRMGSTSCEPDAFQTRSQLDVKERSKKRKKSRKVVRKTKSAQKPPHIIFILADDLGYADVGYHDNQIKTPSIDFLAKSGIRLENYYSQQICAPSRAVLLTGKYVSHNKLGHNITPRDSVCLPQEHHLLPQELKAHGYSTHLIGKWHMGRSSWDCLPEKRGFDSFVGIHGGGASYVDHTQRYNSEHHGYALYNGSRVALEHRGTYAPEIYQARAVELIREHRRQNSKPLFLMLSTQLAHAPNFDIPMEYMKGNLHHNDTMRAIHAAQATVLDGMVDTIVRTLRKSRMWGNSVIIFTSDNGGINRFGGRNAPLRGWKGEYFEGGVRVPAFINSPLIPSNARGQVFTGLMGMVDWYATIIRGILKKDWSKNLPLDSINMWTGLRNGRSHSPRRQYLISLGSACSANMVDNRTAYRWKEWKYINLGEDSKKIESVFLFNLTADPFETRNLVGFRQDVIRTIKRKITKNFCKTAKSPILPNEVPESSPAHSGGVMKPWL